MADFNNDPIPPHLIGRGGENLADRLKYPPPTGISPLAASKDMLSFSEVGALICDATSLGVYGIHEDQEFPQRRAGEIEISVETSGRCLKDPSMIRSVLGSQIVGMQRDWFIQTGERVRPDRVGYQITHPTRLLLMITGERMADEKTRKINDCLREDLRKSFCTIRGVYFQHARQFRVSLSRNSRGQMESLRDMALKVLEDVNEYSREIDPRDPWNFDIKHIEARAIDGAKWETFEGQIILDRID